jgi:hypothetical protein
MKCAIWVQCVVAVMVISGMGRRARGDSAPDPTILSLFQRGQDVEITLSDPGMVDGNFHLERVQQGREPVLIEDISLSADAAVRFEARCITKFWDPDFCEIYPDACLRCDGANEVNCIGEDCDTCINLMNAGDGEPFMDTGQVDGFCDTYPDYLIDCDGDGKNECCGSVCQEMYEHLVVDSMVPLGQTTYNLILNDYVSESKEIVVIDPDELPHEVDPDRPVDATHGCSITSVGGATSIFEWVRFGFDLITAAW